MKKSSPPRLLRIALGMFPAAFRSRYGHEIWQCIRDARHDLDARGFALSLRFWIAVIADLARAAALEWRRSISPDSILALRRVAGIGLIGAALANVGYDAMSVKLSMGVLAVLLTAAAAISGVFLIRSGTVRASS
jgi:hypothetical protein